MNLKNFGWFAKNSGDDWSFVPQNLGKGWRKVTQFTSEPMIKFGNNFGSEWLDHSQIPHNRWWFYDNPELSVFNYPNPANPRGLKNFIRLTPGSLFTQPMGKRGGVEHINGLLTELSGSHLEWQDIIMPRQVYRNNSRKVLICPSSPNCHKWYYSVDQTTWINQQRQWCKDLGYEAVVWHKPRREDRAKDASKRLYLRLLEGDILCTVSQHSASALETIVAGVPSVVWGEHPTGSLGTLGNEFYADGYLRTPHITDVERWLDSVFLNIRHKQEMQTDRWQEL